MLTAARAAVSLRSRFGPSPAATNPAARGFCAFVVVEIAFRPNRYQYRTRMHASNHARRAALRLARRSRPAFRPARSRIKSSMPIGAPNFHRRRRLALLGGCDREPPPSRDSLGARRTHQSARTDQRPQLRRAQLGRLLDDEVHARAFDDRGRQDDSGCARSAAMTIRFESRRGRVRSARSRRDARAPAGSSSDTRASTSNRRTARI